METASWDRQKAMETLCWNRQIAMETVLEQTDSNGNCVGTNR
jgi:hypothetical protein